MLIQNTVICYYLIQNLGSFLHHNYRTKKRKKYRLFQQNGHAFVPESYNLLCLEKESTKQIGRYNMFISKRTQSKKPTQDNVRNYYL